MGPAERRLLESLQVLVGERGKGNRRALRVDEFEAMFQPANHRTMQRIAEVTEQAAALGVNVDSIVVNLANVSTEINDLSAHVDAEVADVRASIGQVEQGVQDVLVASQEFSVSISTDSASLLRDLFLGRNEAGYWQRWSGQGTLVSPDNEVFTIGKTWAFTVLAGQQDGMQTRSDGANWRGAAGSDIFQVEIDFTLVSGGLAGAGVLFDWVNDAGTVFQVAVNLADMLTGPVVAGEVANAVFAFQRPDSFTGAFDFNRIYLVANAAILGDAAKEIRFHRCAVRPTNLNEAVIAEVEAQIEAEAVLRANADSALASQIDTVATNLNGVSATVTSQATAISTLEGNATATLAFRVKAGSGGAQLELVAADDPSGSVSVARIAATDIILDGTVTAGMMNVTELSAISANIGTFQSASSGERIVIEDDRISVFDSGNQLRVRIGNLS